jgi:hypothetical protein
VRFTRADRLLWVWIPRVWDGWRAAVVIVKPETVLAWHRRGFRLLWTWKSRRRVGRPDVTIEGEGRRHGENLKKRYELSKLKTHDDTSASE